jgi:CBS domain containing-hemolysin-like protein
MEDSTKLLSTILVGNTFVNFAAATIGYGLFAKALPSWGGFVAVPVMTVLLLLFGEITPKRFALRHAERLAPACARAMLVCRAVFTPFNSVFAFASRAFAPALERERRALSDVELISVLESLSEHGGFSAADAEMIEGVLRLSELHANDEMTPRVDMEGLDSDRPDEVRRAVLAKARHAYLPVFRRTPDAIEGIVDARTGKIEEALFVPEQITLDDLLVVFRKSGKPLAVVLDEYGGTAGIITPNDVLEIVVGPGVFASPDAEPSIRQTALNAWVIDGRASLDEINRELGIELDAADADRLSGWVAYHAERIPHVGQQIVADGCRATVLRRRRRRVMQVKLEVVEFPKTASDAEMLAETDLAVRRTEEDR